MRSLPNSKMGELMNRVGIISGTIDLSGMAEGSLREQYCETDFGDAVLFVSDEIAWIPRHGTDPRNHILPHLVNYRANLAALRSVGVTDIVGVNSTGSLKAALKPGMVVIPDDFISLMASPSIFTSTAVHITPALSVPVRTRLVKSARACGADPVDGGVYWQTAGPRLETRAEIRMMSQYADLVGMTMADEAVCANELELQYASICSVDNYAHGLVDNPLTMEEIMENARRNRELISKIIKDFIEKSC